MDTIIVSVTIIHQLQTAGFLQEKWKVDGAVMGRWLELGKKVCLKERNGDRKREGWVDGVGQWEKNGLNWASRSKGRMFCWHWLSPWYGLTLGWSSVSSIYPSTCNSKTLYPGYGVSLHSPNNGQNTTWMHTGGERYCGEGQCRFLSVNEKGTREGRVWPVVHRVLSTCCPNR